MHFQSAGVGILKKEEFKSLTGLGTGRPGHVPDTKWPGMSAHWSLSGYRKSN